MILSSDIYSWQNIDTNNIIIVTMAVGHTTYYQGHRQGRYIGI